MAGNIDATTLDIAQPDPHQFDDPAAELTQTQARIYDLWLTTGHRNELQLRDAFETKYGPIKPSKFRSEFRKLKKIIVTFNRNELRELILIEYELLYSEAMQAWLNSKEDVVEYIETRIESAEDFKETATEKRKPQTGDPRHWRNAASALDSIRAMAGVDEPKRIEAIITREMEIIMGYLERTMNVAAFEEFVAVMSEYDADKLK